MTTSSPRADASAQQALVPLETPPVPTPKSAKPKYAESDGLQRFDSSPLRSMHVPDCDVATGVRPCPGDPTTQAICPIIGGGSSSH
eukprot:4523766-Karenia_brevis.AAC.1